MTIASSAAPAAACSAVERFARRLNLHPTVGDDDEFQDYHTEQVLQVGCSQGLGTAVLLISLSQGISFVVLHLI